MFHHVTTFCIGAMDVPPPNYLLYWCNRYSTTFEENRISKDMLMDLNKVMVTLATLWCAELLKFRYS
jgi:hypothetical protein